MLLRVLCQCLEVIDYICTMNFNPLSWFTTNTDKKATDELRIPVPAEQDRKPISGGRDSVPDTGTLMDVILNEIAIVESDYPFELIDVLYHLATFNDDLSYAVDNIIQLGNTEYTIEFEDSISDETTRLMQQELEMCEKSWYLGGVNSLINDALGQAAITGAVSLEAIPSNSLDGIKRVVQVYAGQIRFRYDMDADEYAPYQLPPHVIGRSAAVDQWLIPLNEVTYSYLPIRRWKEKPYAIPPFFAALESIKIERDMICGLKNLLRRLGIFGFLNVLVNPPAQNQGEAPDDYYHRMAVHLRKNVEPEVKKGFDKGYVIGFKDSHEFQMQPTTTDVQGVKDLFELVSTMKHSGLKQDSILFGRGYTTTETLGRVILAKMSNQVKNYQKLVAAFLEKLFVLHLQLKGYPIRYAKVTFNAPMIGDAIKEEQATTARISNGRELYAAGIISQQQLAEYLGYDEPDQEEPRVPVNPLPAIGNVDDPIDAATTDANSLDDLGFAVYQAADSLGAGYPEFPYESCTCSGIESLAQEDELDKFIKDYFSQVRTGYGKATDKLTGLVGTELAKLGQGASVQAVTDSVLYTLFTNWDTEFTAKQKAVINKFVKLSYRYFRQDQAIFKGGAVPDATFGVLDYRTMEYYKDSDTFYLGKMITDEDKIKKITAYIKEAHLNGDLALNDPSTLKAFRKQFATLLQGFDWKILQIISTTVSRMRGTAAIAYMGEAEVEQYEWTTVRDRLRCAYCAALQGRRFSVDSALKYIDTVAKSDPRQVSLVTPFVTSLVKPDDIKGLTSDQLQSKGIHQNPAHPHCRCTLVAVL